MISEKIYLASKTIEISEHTNYIELTNRLCYYDDKNLNNVMLPYEGTEESAKEIAQTLVNMPLQAKYKKIKNKPDFGGHELSIDKDGNAVWGTQSIGTHTKVWISEPEEITTISGENKKLPCLYAVARVWKRNPNIIAAIKRLYTSENGLNSSWEVSVNAYEYSNGVKKLTDYEFIGNVCLGSQVTPAYDGTSKIVSIASEITNNELMIAEALYLDITENETSNIHTNQKEDDASYMITKNNLNIETSALTIRDLMRRIDKAVNDKIKDTWVYPVFLFPEEKIVWCDYGKKDSELDYLKFTYTVGEGDIITVSNAEKITLVASPKDINTVVSEYEASIAEKDDLILQASEELNSLRTQNAELSQYKEKFEQAEQTRINEEIKQKRKDLIASVVKSGQITQEELESSEELKGYVDTLDKKSLMAVIGERLTSSITKKQANNSIITSQIQGTQIHVATNLNTTDNEMISEQEKASAVRRFLNIKN